MSSFGVDLGTTFSSGAFYNINKVEVIDLKGGEKILPSIVQFGEKGDPNKVIVGVTAQNNLTRGFSNILYDAKRLIGKKYDEIDLEYFEHCPFKIVNRNGFPKYSFDGIEKDPVEVSAEILKCMYDRAKERIVNGKSINDCVITVPAYFKNAQRQATRKAGELAGLNILRLINEPTAAAIAYVYEHEIEFSGQILIYDFGGGTFDVSIIEVKDRTISVLATGGDNRLGGQDLTTALLDYVMKEAEINYDIHYNIHSDKINDKKKIIRLRKACNDAKLQLSQSEDAGIQLNDDYDLIITRATFEDICSKFFDRTIKILDETIDQLPDPDVKQIVLVGGSSRIPKVEQILRERYRIPILKAINPDEAVSIGAAYYAESLIKNPSTAYVIKDILNHTIGILGYNRGKEVYVRVLKRRTELPFHKCTYFANQENAPDAVVNVFEGEDDNIRKNTKIGEVKIALERKPINTIKIEVKFSMDLNGVLTVTAKANGVPTTCTIEI